jgi:hypothetical protein
MSNRSPQPLANGVGRVLESTQRGVGRGESAYRRVFGIPKPVERPCDGSSDGDCGYAARSAGFKRWPNEN